MSLTYRLQNTIFPGRYTLEIRHQATGEFFPVDEVEEYAEGQCRNRDRSLFSQANETLEQFALYVARWHHRMNFPPTSRRAPAAMNQLGLL